MHMIRSILREPRPLGPLGRRRRPPSLFSGVSSIWLCRCMAAAVAAPPRCRPGAGLPPRPSHQTARCSKAPPPTGSCRRRRPGATRRPGRHGASGQARVILATLSQTGARCAAAAAPVLHVTRQWRPSAAALLPPALPSRGHGSRSSPTGMWPPAVAVCQPPAGPRAAQAGNAAPALDGVHMHTCMRTHACAHRKNVRDGGLALAVLLYIYAAPTHRIHNLMDCCATQRCQRYVGGANSSPVRCPRLCLVELGC